VTKIEVFKFLIEFVRLLCFWLKPSIKIETRRKVTDLIYVYVPIFN